jgi:hypothetical protein
MPAHTRVLGFAKLGTRLFAAHEQGLHMSTDGGSSWVHVTAGLPSSGFSTIVAGGSALYLGSYTGFFVSTDQGASWKPENSGPVSTPDVLCLALHGSNIFAGLTGLGVWKRPLSDLSSSVQPAGGSVPGVFTLDQNFPNPFNPATVISFSLPRADVVSLRIFNLLGEEVATLVNAPLPSGRHSVTWNGRSKASGVYFYQIRAGSEVLVKKMILLQ